MHVQNVMNSLWDIHIFLGLVSKESPCTLNAAILVWTQQIRNIRYVRKHNTANIKHDRCGSLKYPFLLGPNWGGSYHVTTDTNPFSVTMCLNINDMKDTQNNSHIYRNYYSSKTFRLISCYYQIFWKTCWQEDLEHQWSRVTFLSKQNCT